MLKPLLTAALMAPLMARPVSLAISLAISLPALAEADPAPPEAERAVQEHILPGFSALADSTARLSDMAAQNCDPAEPALRSAWGAAFDDWIEVSHLRFGPTETENRAFAMGFWPDGRSKTPKSLTRLIADQDPIITTPEGIASLSIAARGFYALEYLLYDARYQENTGYACALTQALSADLAATAGAMARDWANSYAQLMLTPGSEYSPYQSADEVRQELFKALATGLQFTSDTRLGRPLGTFDKPRPKRAEAWRSGRALHHVIVSLQTLRALALILSENDDRLSADVARAFDQALAQALALEDPVFAGVDDPAQRLKIEILKQTIDTIREQQLANIGAKLGVAAGFNALDGD
ncbi:imelysin family protein [Thalassobius sp. S69A]|uniref:imelysin family protein n=1 Tax=unclassified Thalassovita TaxID=2619711 RepID=UPI003C7C1A99